MGGSQVRKICLDQTWFLRLDGSSRSSDPPPVSTNQPPTLASLFSHLSPEEKQEISDQLNLELSILLGVLYFMVESFRGEEEWGDELSMFCLESTWQVDKTINCSELGAANAYLSFECNG
jgi:hypothetical protein